MNTLKKHFSQTLVVVFLAVSPLSGQVAIDEQDQVLRQSLPSTLPLKDGAFRLPELYDGELEDVGPQFLLLREPPHQYFRILGDLQYIRTSNVNLSSEDEVSSDILVATVETSFFSRPVEMFEGEAFVEIAFRAQNFDYGAFTDSGRMANGAVINHNDFQAYNPFVRVHWERDGWFAGVGFSYNHLRGQRPERETFYREYVPSVRFGYNHELTPRDWVVLQYEGNYRETSAPTMGVVSDNWNNRTDQRLSVHYRKVVYDRILVQPYYMFQFTEYTGGRDRRDYLNTVGIAGSYYVSDSFSVRAFANYDKRRSTPSRTYDYTNTNAGLGLTANARF
ncbi:MAG: hypothetical protein JJT75_08950 [Opitutales bacterium]|nr:hypothetical protein [Opitutales bacterium]MCH8539168.1 hypothetical protein [Opitutales bacterium]